MYPLTRTTHGWQITLGTRVVMSGEGDWDEAVEAVRELNEPERTTR